MKGGMRRDASTLAILRLRWNANGWAGLDLPPLK